MGSQPPWGDSGRIWAAWVKGDMQRGEALVLSAPCGDVVGWLSCSGTGRRIWGTTQGVCGGNISSSPTPQTHPRALRASPKPRNAHACANPTGSSCLPASPPLLPQPYHPISIPPTLFPTSSGPPPKSLAARGLRKAGTHRERGWGGRAPGPPKPAVGSLPRPGESPPAPPHPST